MLPWHPRVMELWSKLHKVNIWIKGVSGNPHVYYVYIQDKRRCFPPAINICKKMLHIVRKTIVQQSAYQIILDCMQ